MRKVGLFKASSLFSMLTVSLGLGLQANAAVVIEFDAAAAGAGNEPVDVVPAWTHGGKVMPNNGSFLEMNNAGNEFSEYTSAAVSGTMVRNTSDYTVEFMVRPTSDLPATDWYANMKVLWRDNQNRFDVTIDMDADDGGAGTTGSLRYKTGFTGDRAEAITGIDWSVARTIAVAYRGATDDFEFFLDGLSQGVLDYATFNNGNGAAGIQDKVNFGDGTNSQGPSAAEWSFVRVHDVALPEPASVGLMAAAGLFILSRRVGS